MNPTTLGLRQTPEDFEFINGTNLFFSRALLATLVDLAQGFGMSGGSIAYGEETALILMARRRFSHIKVYYDPELFVFHLVH